MKCEITNAEIYWLQDLLEAEVHKGTDHYDEEHEGEDYKMHMEYVNALKSVLNKIRRD